MFLIDGIRKLAALPLLWAGQVVGWLRQPACIALLKAAWYVSGDGRVARTALARTHHFFGGQVALAEARQWLQRRPAPEVAYFAGLLAFDDGAYDEAADYLQRGRRLGTDRDGLDDWLELHVIAQRISVQQSPAAYLAVLERFEARRDLTSLVTHRVKQQLVWADLSRGLLDGARVRVRHILQVEDDALTHLAAWALELHAGNAAGAERHRARVTGLPDVQKLYYRAVALGAPGRDEQARACVRELHELDGDAAATAQRVLAGQEVAF